MAVSLEPILVDPSDLQNASQTMVFSVYLHNSGNEESHRIADAITETISSQFSGISVTIQIEPYKGLCIPKYLAGCLLNEKELRDIRMKNETAASMGLPHDPPAS